MLSITQISALTKEILTDNGYATRALPDDWEEDHAFVFEDEYSIVGVVIYATCEDLIERWTEDQGTLTDMISNHVGRGEAKAAEGYLVLLTSGRAAPSHDEVLTSIRYNTSRVRKLVATGENLKMKSDVRRALRPLLPLDTEQAAGKNGWGLDELPYLLESIPEEATRYVVHAYREQEPLLKALHKYVQNQ